jgi:hypothetical protein
VLWGRSAFMMVSCTPGSRGTPSCFVPQIRYTKVRLRCLGGLGGRPHTQGLARWLSCFVATFVASSISEASAKLCPARASRRNSRHHASCRLSQAAPFGTKTCTTRGWASNHSLFRLQRLNPGRNPSCTEPPKSRLKESANGSVARGVLLWPLSLFQSPR